MQSVKKLMKINVDVIVCVISHKRSRFYWLLIMKALNLQNFKKNFMWVFNIVLRFLSKCGLGKFDAISSAYRRGLIMSNFVKLLAKLLHGQKGDK